MISQYTQDLITKHGWTFIHSHDRKGPEGFSDVAVPESWYHETHGVAWSIEEVLEHVDQDIMLEIERGE